MREHGKCVLYGITRNVGRADCQIHTVLDNKCVEARPGRSATGAGCVRAVRNMRVRGAQVCTYIRRGDWRAGMWRSCAVYFISAILLSVSLAGRSWKFWLDLLGCLPYDSITYAIVSAANGGQVSDSASKWIDWLKLLTLVRACARVFSHLPVVHACVIMLCMHACELAATLWTGSCDLATPLDRPALILLTPHPTCPPTAVPAMLQTRVYRIFELYSLLDYRMVLSQGALMILRNYTYVFFTIQ